MCLISFAIEQHHSFPFIMVANRDEFYQRPSEVMHEWEDRPNILAGRDLKLKGTWLGFNKQGKFSAVTNYRRPSSNNETLLSRGHLITDALLTTQNTKEHLQALQETAHLYGLYNLLVGDDTGIYFHSNAGHLNGPVAATKLEPGVYGLCNASLDTPWPKLTAAKRELQQHIKHNDLSIDSLSELLNQETKAADESLPDTGIALEWERSLSSQFIQLPEYGTRAKTIILQNKEGTTQIREISYNSKGEFARKDFTLQLNVFGCSA